eukprot:CAMPEP_0179371670 /NCGR_PEP_ID=MMETSP0797-20121207/85841_1 /TAXON_ID=47934 /ORGANISM="Dinophysis acuminata, Strain DAEP01" /LENGTH=431 /DNA_ID=CAMNT_0021087521 /DNA_START=75 /DNA_END=1370 /DNA_ORIENTATION=-
MQAGESDSEASVQDFSDLGGWALGDSDDEYHILGMEGTNVDHDCVTRPLLDSTVHAPASNDYRLWLESVSYQVGNTAHEVRNALRFWSSLVSPNVRAEGYVDDGALPKIKSADNKSGKIEAKMRSLVGRIRNRPKVSVPLQKVVPDAQALLNHVWSDLSVLDAAPSGVLEQRNKIEGLIARQQRLLSVLRHAGKLGQQPERDQFVDQDRIDFGSWTEAEEDLVARAAAAIAAQKPLHSGAELALARLCCNAAHQLQNLAAMPRGGKGTQAYKLMKNIDKVAGQCESASRAIMVLTHRWKIKRGQRQVAGILERAGFLLAASRRCEEALRRAVAAQGGSSVPEGDLALALGRLSSLAGLLSEPLFYSTCPAASAPKCENCAYIVTGVTPRHCCARCRKKPGTHGGRCQRVVKQKPCQDFAATHQMDGDVADE